MKNRANPLLIGTFFVAAICLFVAALVLFGSGRFFKKKEYFILFFESSLNGLEVGSPVKFRGVTVGEVDRILLRLNEQDETIYTPVIINIYEDRFAFDGRHVAMHFTKDNYQKEQIVNGLKARLELQSYVTGRLYIDLDYLPQSEFPSQKFDCLGYRRIPTVRSQFREMWIGAVETLAKIARIDFVSIAANINETFSILREGLKDVPFKKISESMIGTSESISQLVRSDGIKDAILGVKRCSDNIGDLVAPDSEVVRKLESSLEEFQRAAKEIRMLADFLSRNPNALLVGKANQGPE